MKCFSIIVPCYNEEKNIVRCLNSLINQSYPAYEIIVINDGSTDKTKNILKNFKKNNKIKVVNKKKNEGRAKALNEGLKVAKGNIIAVTDADSIAPEDWLSNIKKEFDKDKRLEAVGGVYESIGKDIFSLAGNMFERIFMDFGFIPNLIPGGNTAFKADLVKGLGGYPEKSWAEDAALGMLLKKKKNKLKIFPKVVIKTEYPRKIKIALKRKFYWGGGLGSTVDEIKLRFGFLIRPFYFLILFLSLALTLIYSFISYELFMINLGIFLGIILIPTLFFLLLSLIWITKEKKYEYLKALPTMLFLPLLQELSYFVGFMYVLVGGKLKNAWR